MVNTVNISLKSIEVISNLNWWENLHPPAINTGGGVNFGSDFVFKSKRAQRFSDA